MPRYTDDSRERVRDAVDFVELVGARTELKPAGPRRMTGLCPFHDERTPSFGIDPVEKLYHCFGCGAGGDVFKFAMETEGLDFAQRAGGARRARRGSSSSARPRIRARPSGAARRERLLALLERTAAYYVRVLWESAEAAPARAYLAERGLQEDVLREFRVGFSPRAWDRVIGASRARRLRRGGAARRRAGLAPERRHRAARPLPRADHVPARRSQGARARLRRAGDARPTTSRSTSTRRSPSSSTRAAWSTAPTSRARRRRASGRLVLVEGYTDVIALRQAGIPETVCSMGTALTDRQLDALKRLTPKVLLCQDPDAAGQEAVAKGKDAIRAFNEGHHLRGFDLRVVRLPPGQDPADVVQREGPEAMRALLETSVPVPRFEVERALDAADLGTPEGRDDALRVVAPVVGRLDPGPLQYDLIQRIAEPAADAGGDDPGGAAPRAARRTARDRGPLPPAPRRARGDVDRPARGHRARVPRPLPGDQGRRAAARWRRWTSTRRSRVELTRRAAHYLAEHLEHPGQSLPADADELASLVAELVIKRGRPRGRSGGAADRAPPARQEPAGPGDRRRRSARASRSRALAAERQRVHDQIRHRLV